VTTPLRPDTHYVRSGDVHIAYQVFGDAPLDLVIVPTWISQVEHLWEEPRVVDFLERVTSFARVITFDRRGSGLSDRAVGAPDLESQMEDVLAVMDAAGSERAALLAQLEGGPMALMFAATHRERSSSVVLFSSWARLTRAPGYECGNTPEEREALVGGMLHAWGSGRRGPLLVPSLAGDAGFARWFGALERLAASPGSAREIMDLIGHYYVRDVLSTVEVPTLVMNRREDELVDRCHSRYLASAIAGAKHMEMPGRDTLLPFGEIGPVVDEIEEFLTGTKRIRPSGRILATVLFTDIVGSTKLAADVGDRRWRELLDRHSDVTGVALHRFRGNRIKSTGDGLLATFDGPARAIRCAQEVVGELDRIDIPLRVGLHTGEIEMVGDDVAGLAVHIGARVCQAAGPGQVLASSTVRDLVVGSEIRFADRGTHELRGVPYEWRLYEVLDEA
jgi:class 3 adenylate cyclase/alpha-beta hydrolase superfamily lysophospholipase